jgi:antitoxin component of MazEF toxin-antitoxin module
MKKIGNSKGVVIPASIVKTLAIQDAEVFTITTVGQSIILTRLAPLPATSLSQLFHSYEGSYQPSIVFEDKLGDEVW